MRLEKTSTILKKRKLLGYADDLMTSGHALSTLLNEVLDMAKVATGTPLVKKNFDLREKWRISLTLTN